jgi:hypothetical protein
MKITLTAATLAALALATAPTPSRAADASHTALDACVKVLVTQLGERYGKVPTVRETRYPQSGYGTGTNLEFTLLVADTRAADRTVARASCTVTPTGRVLWLETESPRRL